MGMSARAGPPSRPVSSSLTALDAGTSRDGATPSTVGATTLGVTGGRAGGRPARPSRGGATPRSLQLSASRAGPSRASDSHVGRRGPVVIFTHVGASPSPRGGDPATRRTRGSRPSGRVSDVGHGPSSGTPRAVTSTEKAQGRLTRRPRRSPPASPGRGRALLGTRATITRTPLRGKRHTYQNNIVLGLR